MTLRDLSGRRVLRCGLDPQQRSVSVVVARRTPLGQHVERAVGTLPDITKANAELHQQRFGPADDLTLAIEREPLDLLAAQAGDEEIAPPAGERIARVEEEVRRVHR